jgi:hypothetical protein
MTTPNPADALKYAAAILQQRMEWTTDAISGSQCDGDHDIELDAIGDVSAEISALAASFGDLDRYSDGRRVKSRAEIAFGLITEHVWHPDATQEESRSWRSNLLSGDPDVQSPGIYEVTTIPETQQIDVRVLRIA